MTSSFAYRSNFIQGKMSMRLSCVVLWAWVFASLGWTAGGQRFCRLVSQIDESILYFHYQDGFLPMNFETSDDLENTINRGKATMRLQSMRVGYRMDVSTPQNTFVLIFTGPNYPCYVRSDQMYWKIYKDEAAADKNEVMGHLVEFPTRSCRFTRGTIRTVGYEKILLPTYGPFETPLHCYLDYLKYLKHDSAGSWSYFVSGFEYDTYNKRCMWIYQLYKIDSTGHNYICEFSPRIKGRIAINPSCQLAHAGDLFESTSQFRGQVFSYRPQNNNVHWLNVKVLDGQVYYEAKTERLLVDAVPCDYCFGPNRPDVFVNETNVRRVDNLALDCKIYLGTFGRFYTIVNAGQMSEQTLLMTTNDGRHSVTFEKRFLVFKSAEEELRVMTPFYRHPCYGPLDFVVNDFVWIQK